MSRIMKDSGIPWLKEIPSSWNVERGKNVLVLLKRPTRDDDEVVTCFRDGEVILRSERRTEGFTMSDKEIGYQGINKGDIVIHGMDGFAGAMGISKSQGKGSPVLIVCNPKYDAISRYIIYYLRSLAMTDVFVALATGIRERSCDLRWNKISELEFILPSASEQKAIADFLDKKCTEIDELISLQEKIIDELTAYRQSIITETVTKGLNPNSIKKDSGIQWIGEIPNHWNVERIETGLTEIVEKNSPIKTDYVLSLTNTRGVIPYDEKGDVGNKSKDNHEDYKIAYPNTIVANSMNILIGSVGICNYYGCVSPVYYVFKKRGNANLRFYNYILSSVPFQKHLRQFANGILEIRLRVSSSDILKRHAPTPPYQEQEEIADYLDEKCSKIDKMISIKQSKIEALKEYKKSIIYECVTGKKDVI